MIYGIAHQISFEGGVLIKTPIGYVVGIENIVAYNEANSPDIVIEQGQENIPEGLEEI